MLGGVVNAADPGVLLAAVRRGLGELYDGAPMGLPIALW